VCVLNSPSFPIPLELLEQTKESEPWEKVGKVIFLLRRVSSVVLGLIRKDSATAAAARGQECDSDCVVQET